MAITAASLHRGESGQKDTYKGKPYKIMLNIDAKDQDSLFDAKYLLEQKVRSSISWSVYLLCAHECIVRQLQQDQ